MTGRRGGRQARAGDPRSPPPTNPAAHSVHDEDPLDSLYFPLSHATHSDARVALMVPGSQAVQLMLVALEYRPASHAVCGKRR